MDSEAFVIEILKKHGEFLDLTSSSIVKLNGLVILTAYLKAILPGFKKVEVQRRHDEDFAKIAITFCPCQKFYAPETRFLKFIYNGALVQCSSNPNELLEAIELAAKYGKLGIEISSNSTVFFKDNYNFHGSSGFFLFKQGMTVKDILETVANPPASETFVI